MSAVVVPGWVVSASRGVVHVLVVGAAAHSSFLATAVLALGIAVGNRGAIVVVVLDAMAELGLFTLVVAIVEVGAHVLVLTEVTQHVMEILLVTWSVLIVPVQK